MISLKQGDVVTTYSGLMCIVHSQAITLNSCGRPIVSVWTGESYIPCDVAAIAEVNGVAVEDVPTQLSLFGEVA